MTQKEVENLYLTQAVIIRTMQDHSGQFDIQVLKYAVARIFAIGEILQYGDEEIIEECKIGWMFNDDARAKMDVDRQEFEKEIERMNDNAPGKDDPFNSLF